MKTRRSSRSGEMSSRPALRQHRNVGQRQLNTGLPNTVNTGYLQAPSYCSNTTAECSRA